VHLSHSNAFESFYSKYLYRLIVKWSGVLEISLSSSDCLFSHYFL